MVETRCSWWLEDNSTDQETEGSNICFPFFFCDKEEERSIRLRFYKEDEWWVEEDAWKGVALQEKEDMRLDDGEDRVRWRKMVRDGKNCAAATSSLC